MNQGSIVAWLFFTLSPAFTAADQICLGSGPQTPRDISQKFGTNTSSFNLAPSYRDMNLCNIHTHTFAEHKALDSQFPLIMDKLTDFAAMTLQDYLRKNSQIQRMEVALFKAYPRVIRLKCIGYIPLAPFSQVKDWALASAPLVRTPN